LSTRKKDAAHPSTFAASLRVCRAGLEPARHPIEKLDQRGALLSDLIRALRPVVAQLRKYSPDAADQVERAASSIVLNLAEGDRRNGRDPKRFFDMAHGSAGEIRGALDAADAWGWQIESTQARALLDRELALLWGLTRRSRAKAPKARNAAS
jgi:four helix bundle protein